MKIEDKRSTEPLFKELSSFSRGTPVMHRDGSVGIVIQIIGEEKNRIVWACNGLADTSRCPNEFREIKARLVIED